MHIVNERGTIKISSLHIFCKDPQEMGETSTLRLKFQPYNLIERFTTIQNEEPGRILTLTLDVDRFEIYGHWWKIRANRLLK